MSAVAVIVIALVGVLLVAMLVAGARRSTAASEGAVDDEHSFRSHAEASRGHEEHEPEHEVAEANGRP